MDIISAIVPFIIGLAAKYPITASILMVIGVLRSIFKPIMSVLAAYAAATPSVKDDAALAKLQANKIYMAFAWFLDYSASIKLPGQK